eukprot:12893956-Prorocentrum_lima.AAC.1
MSIEQAHDIEVHGHFLLFYGTSTKAHQALPAKGARYSVLWYTPLGWRSMTAHARARLPELLF